MRKVIDCNDQLISYEAAEQIAGQRLDRRRKYKIIKDQVCMLTRWSEACSGCYEGYDGHHERGSGCHECGYTGRSRQAYWMATTNQAKGEK